MGKSDLRKCDILGVLVNPVNINDAVAAISDSILNKRRMYVCVTGVHGIMESQYRSAIKDIHNKAGMVTPDGMPLVWLSRIRGFKNVGRVYGPDLMLAVCKYSLGKGFRHFFYGGTPEIVNKLVNNLRCFFPGIIVAGSYCPPFRSLTEEEECEVISVINNARSDIVWIGLSTPKQEIWMSRYSEKLNPTVLIGVGAAFDFHAGLKKQAPAWMQRSGLEWFFRLSSEPKRLWKRYLVNNVFFICLLIWQPVKLLFSKKIKKSV